MSVLAVLPAVPASIRPPAVRRYVANAKTVVALVPHLHSANPAEDSTDLDVGHLNQFQGSRFLKRDIGSSGTSDESLG